MDINSMQAGSGRMLKEDSTPINIADAVYEGIPSIEIIVRGKSTGGSQTTIVDTSQNIEANLFVDCVARLDIGGIAYLRTISANTADTITIGSLPGASASCVYGESEGGQITIVVVDKGSAGNDYTLVVSTSEEVSQDPSASLDEMVLTVLLGTDETGAADNSKNTGTAIAALIDALDEFTATMTGSGGVVAETTDPATFNGGVNVVSVSSGTEYKIIRPI